MARTLNLKGARFLIADSSPFFQDLLRGILRQFGATDVVLAADGDRAFGLYTSQVFDVLISEAIMPGLSGFELCRRIRRHDDPVIAFNPIIVLTSHTQPENVRHARDCGATTVLAKPIAPKILFERLLWIVEDDRPFIRGKGYVGPDRRFRDDPPPPGEDRRGNGDNGQEPAAGSGEEALEATVPSTGKSA